jgi:hypothetical protein
VLNEIVSEKGMASSMAKGGEPFSLVCYFFPYLMTKGRMIQTIKKPICEKKNLDT